jgi:hypothetical protein
MEIHMFKMLLILLLLDLDLDMGFRKNKIIRAIIKMEDLI